MDRPAPEPSRPVAELLASALQGAVYPLERDEVLAIARENEAPGTILSLLGRLPDRRYASEAEIADEVSGRAPEIQPGS